MNVSDLIDSASRKKCIHQKDLAAELGVEPSRISNWKWGKLKPDANEIAFFAKKAGLPVLETVAEIEASFNSRYAPIWYEALGKLRAAGVAATVILTLGTSLMMPTSDAHAGSKRSGGEGRF